MRFQALCHVPFEGPANIETWIHSQEYSLRSTHLWKNEKLPSVHDLDFLIILGGPMNIYEDEKFPWLVAEKKIIEQALRHKKKILGVCLGAQLLAEVLGAAVFKNDQKEIGWFPVELTAEGKKCLALEGLHNFRTVFHWHGDTFHLPQGAIHLARSQACENQAFFYEQALGLQFHLESTPASVKLLIENCKEELIEGKFIQSEQEILGRQEHYPNIQNALYLLLDQMVKCENPFRASEIEVS